MAGTWSEHVTKEGRTYYYNRETRESSWDRPAEMDATTKSSNEQPVKQAPDDWEELWDPKNERPYYHNRATRKTQWLKPENVEIKPYSGKRGASSRKDKKHHKTSEGPVASSQDDSVKAKATHATEPKASSNNNTEKQEEESVETPQKEDETMKASNDVIDKQSNDTAKDEAPAVETAQTNNSTSVPTKKRKKKVKKDKSDVENAKRKRRKDNEKRLIICDDEGQVLDPSSSMKEKDTDDGKEATRLLQEMSRTDAIMEANVLSVINAFLRVHPESNGPEILVERLSSSYRGHAQLIGLAASWLDAFPLSKTSAERQMLNSSESGKDGPTWEASNETLYKHLKGLIAEHYDPSMVSNVLSDSTVEPEWLTQMLGDNKWRRMLIELAEKHKTCTLLQYAIRRISEAGHHKEIASVTNADAFFSVFNGVVLDAFCRIPLASEEQVLEDLAALKKICCHSSYSFTYTQELLCKMDQKLHQLQMSAGDRQTLLHYRTVRSKLNRVRLELHEKAFDLFGGQVEALHPLRRKHLYQENKRLSTAILSIVQSKKCSEEASEVLVKEFTQRPPPVAHLRDPMVFRSLLDRLFDPSESISTTFTQNCIELLAYAASARDERSILDPTGPADEAGVSVDQDEVDKTKKALEEASVICKSDSTLGYNMSQSGVVERLVSVMDVPIASMGVLHWLEVILKSPAFLTSTLLHICFPSLLRILKASIRLHSGQWPIVFRVLVTALRLHLEVNPVKALELKRESLRCMIFMITSGYVLPVLEFVQTNTLELDQALLRDFVTELIRRISPPYSSKFVHALAKVLIHPKVQSAVKSCPADSMMKLHGFVRYCKKNPEMVSSELLQSLVIMQKEQRQEQKGR